MSAPVAVVCNTCGHQWQAPYEDDLPTSCENCRSAHLTYFPLRIVGNDEAAEEHGAAVWEWLQEKGSTR